MSWQHDLRHGLAPLLADDTLHALLDQCENGGERLIREEYVRPLDEGGDPEPWAAGCLLGYCAAIQSHCRTNIEVSRAASDLAHRFVERLEPDPLKARAPYLYALMRWWDNTPPEQSLPDLADEVRAILAERKEQS